jgi:N-acetylglucosaminyldiphosphoundecaprenol N-acetyl-beta-D-mannosaminyltransferase
MKRIIVGRIPVDLFTDDSLQGMVSQVVSENSRKTVLHSNANLVQLANTTDRWLIPYFNEEVDYVICDGAGIQIGAKITGQQVPLKIAYNVWFWKFAAFCNLHNYSIFLLGGKEGVAKRAARRLVDKNPGLVVHYHHGYFDKNPGSSENLQVIEHINQAKPQILLVCFGQPLQEKYIRENVNKFKVNIIMSAGGALDFFAGDSKTAPVIFRKLYLEWFYRMCADPKRLWKRYLIGNIKFLYYSIKHGAKK